MKLARPIGVAVVVGVVIVAVFAVFAVELASAQTRSRNEIKTEVKDRAELAASLVNSLFATTESSKTQYSTDYGARVDLSKLDKAAQGEAYAVVTDSSGRVIAASSGFNTQIGLAVPAAQLSRLADQHVTYYLGNFEPYGTTQVSDFVVPFPASASTTRLLVTGLDGHAAGLTGFFENELRGIPGVRGETNYLLDGNGLVIAASDPKIRIGSVLGAPSRADLRAASGEAQGSYFQQAPMESSTWSFLVVAPSGTLFSSIEGPRAYVPWIIFIALVVVALIAAFLAYRVLRAAEIVTDVNSKLESVNEELSLANESLHRRAEELARSNEELESFASIASHDLQEPLRKVRTFTEQLSVLEAERLSDKGRDYLERANSAAERMQKLIADLLKFSRVSTQGHPFEQVDLAEVTDHVIDDLERQVQETGATVEVGDLPVITADPLQMQQLMQNLISNALKFRRPDVAPVVKVGAVVEGGKVKLSVADNGIGFEPRYAARIFRIFERLHGRTEYPGTGIGLALVRKIADRHGGTVEAESQLGHGATFTVVLPVSQPAGSLGFGANARAREETPVRAGV